MKYICKKSSSYEMLAISLSSCSRYKANLKLDQSVFAIHDSQRLSETLDFANAFLSISQG